MINNNYIRPMKNLRNLTQVPQQNSFLDLKRITFTFPLVQARFEHWRLRNSLSHKMNANRLGYLRTSKTLTRQPVSMMNEFWTHQTVLPELYNLCFGNTYVC